MMDTIVALWTSQPEWLRTTVVTVGQILAVTITVILTVAYLTLAERKVIGYMQVRIGPNRVGPYGLLQPFADVIKLLLKEVVIPSRSNRFLFVVAPLLTLTPAFAAWAVMSLWPGFSIANVDAGVLYILALAGFGAYGIILAGWAANSKYAFLGAMRSAAQIVAYEIAMGFALVGVVMAAGSLNFGKIVEAQAGGPGSWYWFWLFPLLVVYFIAGVAETNRAPFDVAEGESEIVAGFHVEYSGIAFALFFLAEYANMILIAALTAVFFFGGWQSPLNGYLAPDADLFQIPLLGMLLNDGTHWLAFKTFLFLCLFLWLRATFPRYRYDQIMRLGWKVFIPVTLVWIVVLGAWMQTPLWIWWK